MKIIAKVVKQRWQFWLPDTIELDFTQNDSEAGIYDASEVADTVKKGWK